MSGKARNYTWLLARTKWVVFNNEGQADQAFAGPSTDENLHFREALNEAYKQEVELAQLETSRARWFRTEDVTWAADAVTLELPPFLLGAQIVRVRDVTDSSDGDAVYISDSPDAGTIFRKTESVLQWGTTGPGSTRTLRFTYMAEPEYLGEHPSQEPKLIPAKFRMLLVWRAAIMLVAVGNRQAPSKWEQELEEVRSSFHKFCSRGFVMETDGPRIRMTDDSM